MIVDIVGRLQEGDKVITGRADLPDKDAKRLIRLGRAKQVLDVPVTKVDAKAKK